MLRSGIGFLLLLVSMLGPVPNQAATGADSPNAAVLTVVVMDPLAKPLSCECVEGYAQREYQRLAEYLRERLRCEFDLVFAESWTTALQKKSDGRVDLIIGKDSVVRKIPDVDVFGIFQKNRPIGAYHLVAGS